MCCIPIFTKIHEIDGLFNLSIKPAIEWILYKKTGGVRPKNLMCQSAEELDGDLSDKSNASFNSVSAI